MTDNTLRRQLGFELLSVFKGARVEAVDDAVDRILTALRHPTDAQLDAGKKAVYGYTGLPDRDPQICCAMGLAHEVWVAMTLAAQ